MNNMTGLLFFVIGMGVVILTTIIIYLIRACRKEETDLQTFENIIVWIKTQFVFGYFIRLYQVTMMKNFLSIALLFNFGTKTVDIVIGILFLVFWLVGFPVFLFITLRINQINIMSEEIIKSHGALFLNYRGITKDVYAMLLHLKLIILPIIAVVCKDFPRTQLIFLSILFFFNLIFVSFSMPFNKVSKVFTEALSEGILMFFFVGTLIIDYLEESWDKEIKTFIAVRYSFSGVLFFFLFLRCINSILNMISRIKDIVNFKKKYELYELHSNAKKLEFERLNNNPNDQLKHTEK